MDTFQFILIEAKQRSGNCAGARGGNITLSLGKQGHLTEKVPLSCLKR
jgi:hypothetical protein